MMWNNLSVREFKEASLSVMRSWGLHCWPPKSDEFSLDSHRGMNQLGTPGTAST